MNRTMCIALGVLLVCDPLEASDRVGPGLDLIVMIDRSRSMSGERLEPLPALAGGVIAANAQANQLTHRLGVISFGGDARIDLPLRPTGASLRQAVPRTRHPVAGHTDILAAFEAAVRLFRSIPNDPERRRAMIVITDGVPHVPRRDPDEYVRTLRQFVKGNLSDATIDVLLVRRADGRLWHDLASGRVHDAAGAAGERIAVLHRVVTSLVGTHVAESPSARHTNVIVLPPYLDSVVFDVVHGEPAGTITVLPPGESRPLKDGVGGVELLRVGDVLSTAIVNRPAPGRWTFRAATPRARVRVFAQQFFPRGVLVSPAAAATVRQHDRVTVAYRVVDGDGQPIRELAGYPLSLRLDVSTPTGERVVSAMERRSDLGESVFGSTAHTRCDVPGRYWTEVRITTRDAAQGHVDVFRDRWAGFSVTPAVLVDCRHTLGRVTPLVWSRRVETRLECRDSSGRAKGIGSVSPAALRASLRRNRRPVAAAMTWIPAGDGAFTGSLRGAGSPGSYAIGLAVDGTRPRGRYNVRVHPEEMSFTRALSWVDAVVAVSCTAAAGGVFHVTRRANRTT